MNGVILIPKPLAHSYTSVGCYMPLFELMRDRLGFEIIPADNNTIFFEAPKIMTADVVVTFKAPQKHVAPRAFEALKRLPKTAKLICYSIDIHQTSDLNNQPRDTDFARTTTALYDRADAILCPHPQAFQAIWPEYLDKMHIFPNFFASKYFGGFPKTRKQKPKCLVTGNTGEYYPLRNYVIDNCKQIDRLQNPAWNNTDEMSKNVGRSIRGEYAKKLNQYVCGLASPSTLKYTVMKYFEIPAAGSLLLAPLNQDLIPLGMHPYKHYIPIEEESAEKMIRRACDGWYTNVQTEGTRFVWDNFSEKHAFERMKTIIEEVLS